MLILLLWLPDFAECEKYANSG